MIWEQRKSAVLFVIFRFHVLSVCWLQLFTILWIRFL